MGVPTGWFYWLPPNGGNDAELTAGYENTRITDEEAYDGNYSLKFDIPQGTRDGFVGTRRYPFYDPGFSTAASGSAMDIASLQDVGVGDIIRVSVWIKGKNLVPDSAASVGDSWSLAITPIFHDRYGNNAGWGEIWARDIPLKFPNTTEFDWQRFYVDIQVVEGAQAFSVRMHPLSRFQGTVYIDKLEIQKVNDVTDAENEELPISYNLFQNYPNPFNPSTIISYALPKSAFVSVKIYDMLGREIKTLVNSEQNAGINHVTWNGDNDSGAKVSSGTYIYMIKAGDFTMAKKLVLMK